MKPSKEPKGKPPAKAEVNKSRNLEIVEQPGVSMDRVMAQLALGATMPNVSTALDYSIGLFPGLNLNECAKQMNSDIQAVNGGNLDTLEGMLTGQATALNAIFNNFAKKAVHADVMPKMEAYLRLALKAQSQCRTTVEAIAEIKYPKSATFIKQANIAGQQQVNNGQADSRSSTPAPAHAHEKNITSANELLTESSYAALDTRGAGTTIGTNTQVEALAAFHRAKH